MDVTVHIPDDIATRLRATGGDRIHGGHVHRCRGPTAFRVLEELHQQLTPVGGEALEQVRVAQMNDGRTCGVQATPKRGEKSWGCERTMLVGRGPEYGPS